jgi:hypothetical protein
VQHQQQQQQQLLLQMMVMMVVVRQIWRLLATRWLGLCAAPAARALRAARPAGSGSSRCARWGAPWHQLVRPVLMLISILILILIHLSWYQGTGQLQQQLLCCLFKDSSV